MKRRYNPAHFILVSVIALGLTSLVVGVDTQAQIVFTSEKNDNVDIYVMDADGKNTRRLTNSPRNEWSPAWSPDGERIVFVSNSDIHVMDANGQKHRKLTNNRDGSSPFWSPDGERIVFVSSRDDWRTSDIYVMNPDGKKLQNLTNDLWRDSVPAWSPDGKRIAFTSQRGNDWRDIDIYVMDVNGGNIQNLTNNPLAHDRQPAWYSPAFAVAPVGKQFTMWGWLKQAAQ